MVSNQLLRANARQQLGGGIFKTQWLMFLVVMVIYSVLLSAVSSFTYGIGSMLLMGVLNYGIARVTLAKIRSGSDFKIGELFCGFSECLGDSLLLGLLSNIFIAF